MPEKGRYGEEEVKMPKAFAPRITAFVMSSLDLHPAFFASPAQHSPKLDDGVCRANRSRRRHQTFNT